MSGYEGLKQREDVDPAAEKPRLTRALERLVRLYDAWGKQDEATRWRKQLAAAGDADLATVMTGTTLTRQNIVIRTTRSGR